MDFTFSMARILLVDFIILLTLLTVTLDFKLAQLVLWLLLFLWLTHTPWLIVIYTWGFISLMAWLRNAIMDFILSMARIFSIVDFKFFLAHNCVMDFIYSMAHSHFTSGF